MTSANRPNRKATDAEIIRLNSVGLSYSTIGKTIGCHPTTIKKRLEQLNIPPADTRRTFMEDIYNSLSPAQQKWLEAELGPHISVKDYVRNLLVNKYLQGNKHVG